MAAVGDGIGIAYLSTTFLLAVGDASTGWLILGESRSTGSENMLSARRRMRTTDSNSRMVTTLCRGDDDFLKVNARAFRMRPLAIFPEAAGQIRMKTETACSEGTRRHRGIPGGGKEGDDGLRFR